MWRARFGRDFGPVVRQTTKLMNPSVTAGFFHADRRTDTRKLMVAISNFVRAAKNELLSKPSHGNVLLSAHTLSCLERRLTLQCPTSLL